MSIPYRLYIDESGDHFSSDYSDVGKRYLGLIGVAFRRDEYEEFQHDLHEFKRNHLDFDPDEVPCLHRSDILYRRGPYKVLADNDRREAFDRDLLELIRGPTFLLFGVVIDKFSHVDKMYRGLTHPYHYALEVMLERYCGWMDHLGRRGDVMAESRRRKEDTALKDAYQRVYDEGTTYMKSEICKRVLTSRSIKIKPKEKNTEGLQLADILANPVTRDVLVSFDAIPNRGGSFADEIARTVEPKYNRQLYSEKIRGYGRVLLT